MKITKAMIVEWNYVVMNAMIEAGATVEQIHAMPEEEREALEGYLKDMLARTIHPMIVSNSIPEGHVSLRAPRAVGFDAYEVFLT